ncbi:hypothetical protein LCGC14_0371840 [marine sediment metagenome]|uniref:Ribbon-helix-helix protein CopG domain-containing protein n=1 Tax=marine sediment metagenome TaxID=412755 RepID=A0A0F9TN30_9ZZZZ
MARIVTINVPESWIAAIEKLTGEDSLYFSRSELIRKAIDDRLREIIKHSKANYKPTPIAQFTESDETKIRRLVRETQQKRQNQDLAMH